MLTGPLILDGIVVGYADLVFPVVAAWRDESLFIDFDDQHKELDEPHYRLIGSFGWERLDAADLAQLKALTSKPFPLVLRSRRPGDPMFPEVEVLVRRTNDIEETGPLNRQEAGRPLYRVLIEFEAMETVEQPLGAIEGGYTVVEAGETEEMGEWEVDVLELGVWGEATMTERTMEVSDGAGGTLELSYYSLGPKVLSLLLTRVHPDDDHCIQIDTTGTGRIGTPPLDLTTFKYNTQESTTKGSESSEDI